MPFNVLMYAFWNAIGLLAAFFVSRWLFFPPSVRCVSRVMFAVVLIGAILGSKIPVWLAYGLLPELLWDGKSLFGGLTGGFLAMNLYKKIRKIPDGGFGDKFIIPLCVAAGFGKIGCFCNGCCGGREFFGFIQPTQLYESGFQFSLAVFFYILYRFRKAEGLWFPVYMILYMTMRFLIEFLRNEPNFLFGLTVYQLLTLVLLPVFGMIIVKRVFLRKLF